MNEAGHPVPAASFKNVAQVSAVFEPAAAVTLHPFQLRAALGTPHVAQAVAAFADHYCQKFEITGLP